MCYTYVSYDFALNNYIYISALERMQRKKTVKPHKTKALMFRGYQRLSFPNKFDVIKTLC